MRYIIQPVIVIFLILILCCGCTSSESKGDTKFIDQGIKFYNQGKYQDAALSFERYLIEDNTSTTASVVWAWKSSTYEELARYDLALYCIEQAITIQKENPTLWRSKERILEKLGRNDEAKETARIATELESKQLSVNATSLTILPTVNENQIATQPIHQFSKKDNDYITITSSQITVLSEMTKGVGDLSVSEYRSHGSQFKLSAEKFLAEVNVTSPDDPLLIKSWESYTEALKYYIIAGQWEEDAGSYFKSGNFSAGNDAIRYYAENIERGNSNLSTMEKFINDSGIRDVLK